MLTLIFWCATSLSCCYAYQTVLSSSLQTRITAACIEIELAIEGKAYRRHTPEYNHQQAAYWLADQARDYLPYCRVTPRRTEDVSLSVRLLGKHQIPFAVKSGGHSFLAGASNINHGITLDLSQLNAIVLADDKKTVLLQPAASWLDVYKALEPHGLSAVGGRAGAVGVGGFLLGGGSSWLSNRYGWACDSVLEFEVVVYGNVETASPTENPDLFWALKGGGSNFGIITAVRLATFPHRDAFVSQRSYSKDITPKALLAPQRLTDDAPNDLSTSAFMSFGYHKDRPDIDAGVAIVNVDNNYNAPALTHFSGIPVVIEKSFTTRLSCFAFAANQDNDRDSRKIKFSITVHNNATLLDRLLWTFKNLTRTIAFEDVTGAYMSFQPLTTSHISGRDNALGMSNLTEPLMLVSFEIYWFRSAESSYFEGFARQVHDDMNTQAEHMGLLHRFVYLNYAASWQDPFGSYGTESLRRLRSIQERLRRDHDPGGLFTGLMPGGKKL